MASHDVCIMILSCKALQKRREAMKETLSQVHGNFTFVFLEGDEDQVQEFIFNDKTRVLSLKCGDSYDYLTHKTKYGISACRKLFAFNYLIKMDDDIVIQPVSLSNFIKFCQVCDKDYLGCKQLNPITESNYGSEKYTLEKNKQPIVLPSIPYMGGPCYCLSVKACDIIKDHMDENGIRFEDFNVGLTLYNHDMEAVHCPLYTDYEHTLQPFHVGLHDVNRKYVK